MTQNDADNSLFSLAQIQHLMRVEFNRAQRYGYAISCLMIAVDRLGHLRDMYGYDSKEEIVDTMIRLLKTETRSSDFLGRMADDRLLAVIPHIGVVLLSVAKDWYGSVLPNAFTQIQRERPASPLAADRDLDAIVDPVLVRICDRCVSAKL